MSDVLLEDPFIELVSNFKLLRPLLGRVFQKPLLYMLQVLFWAKFGLLWEMRFEFLLEGSIFRVFFQG